MPYGHLTWPEYESAEEIVIESGVPIPETHVVRREPKYEYPFFEMKVGDSFLIKSDDPDHTEMFRGRALSCARDYKLFNMKFTTRVIGYKTVRVWRTQ
jgi:hypothetical protein